MATLRVDFGNSFVSYDRVRPADSHGLGNCAGDDTARKGEIQTFERFGKKY